MATFSLTARLKLSGPDNLAQIATKINNGLNLKSHKIQVSVDKGSFDQVKAATQGINGEIKRVDSSLSALKKNFSSNTNTAQFSSSLNQVSQAAKKVQKDVKGAKDGVSDFTKEALLVARRSAGFALATSALFGTIRLFSYGVSEAIAFEKEMVKIGQVSDKSLKSLRGLSDEIGRIATEYGTSSKELADVAQTLIQAGIPLKETQRTLETIAKSSLAPSFNDTKNTVEALIAIMGQFKNVNNTSINTGDFEKVLGSINKLSADLAVEADDITAAVRRAGSVFASIPDHADTAIESLNKFNAIFSVVRQNTRESAETIATGLRTIFTRIQRPRTIEFLKQYGVELQDAKGNFVGAYEALKRLSVVFNSLPSNSGRAAEIAEEVAGIRQIAKFLPAVTDQRSIEAAYQKALSGSDSLNEQKIAAQKSLANQIDKTRESFLKLARDIYNSNSFKALATGILFATNAVIRLLDSMKELLPLVLTFAAIKAVPSIFSVAQGARSFFSPVKRNGGGQILGFNTGGLVPGQGSGDTVPAMLEAGEYVIRKDAVRAIGVNNLERANKYAKGGNVSRVKKYKNITGEPVDIHDLYHGTRANFEDKDIKPNYRIGEQHGYGIHFTPDKDFAELYSNGESARKKKGNPRLIKASLIGVKMLDAEQIVTEGTPFFELAKKLAGKKLFTVKNEEGKNQAYLGNAINATNPKRAESILKEYGYDGVTYNAKSMSITGLNRYTINKEALAHTVFDNSKLKIDNFAKGGKVNRGKKLSFLPDMFNFYGRIFGGDVATAMRGIKKPRFYQNMKSQTSGNDIFGRYRPETQQIGILAGLDGRDTKSTIAHEYFHAYTDTFKDLALMKTMSAFGSKNPMMKITDEAKRHADFKGFDGDMRKYFLEPQEIAARSFEQLAYPHYKHMTVPKRERYDEMNKLMMAARHERKMYMENDEDPERQFLNMIFGGKKFARGGSSKDRIPALLTPGEYIINQKAASRIGKARLDKWNKADKLGGQVLGFNKGGQVPGSPIRMSEGGGPIVGFQDVKLFGLESAFKEVAQVSNFLVQNGFYPLKEAIALVVSEFKGSPEDLKKFNDAITGIARATSDVKRRFESITGYPLPANIGNNRQNQSNAAFLGEARNVLDRVSEYQTIKEKEEASRPTGLAIIPERVTTPLTPRKGILLNNRRSYVVNGREPSQQSRDLTLIPGEVATGGFTLSDFRKQFIKPAVDKGGLSVIPGQVVTRPVDDYLKKNPRERIQEARRNLDIESSPKMSKYFDLLRQTFSGVEDKINTYNKDKSNSSEILSLIRQAIVAKKNSSGLDTRIPLNNTPYQDLGDAIPPFSSSDTLLKSPANSAKERYKQEQPNKRRIDRESRIDSLLPFQAGSMQLPGYSFDRTKIAQPLNKKEMGEIFKSNPIFGQEYASEIQRIKNAEKTKQGGDLDEKMIRVLEKVTGAVYDKNGELVKLTDAEIRSRAINNIQGRNAPAFKLNSDNSLAKTAEQLAASTKSLNVYQYTKLRQKEGVDKYNKYLDAKNNSPLLSSLKALFVKPLEKPEYYDDYMSTGGAGVAPTYMYGGRGGGGRGKKSSISPEEANNQQILRNERLQTVLSTVSVLGGLAAYQGESIRQKATDSGQARFGGGLSGAGAGLLAGVNAGAMFGPQGAIAGAIIGTTIGAIDGMNSALHEFNEQAALKSMSKNIEEAGNTLQKFSKNLSEPDREAANKEFEANINKILQDSQRAGIEGLKKNDTITNYLTTKAPRDILNNTDALDITAIGSIAKAFGFKPADYMSNYTQDYANDVGSYFTLGLFDNLFKTTQEQKQVNKDATALDKIKSDPNFTEKALSGQAEIINLTKNKAELDLKYLQEEAKKKGKSFGPEQVEEYFNKNFSKFNFAALDKDNEENIVAKIAEQNSKRAKEGRLALTEVEEAGIYKGERKRAAKREEEKFKKNLVGQATTDIFDRNLGDFAKKVHLLTLHLEDMQSAFSLATESLNIQKNKLVDYANALSGNFSAGKFESLSIGNKTTSSEIASIFSELGSRSGVSLFRQQQEVIGVQQFRADLQKNIEANLTLPDNNKEETLQQTVEGKLLKQYKNTPKIIIEEFVTELFKARKDKKGAESISGSLGISNNFIKTANENISFYVDSINKGREVYNQSIEIQRNANAKIYELSKVRERIELEDLEKDGRLFSKIPDSILKDTKLASITKSIGGITDIDRIGAEAKAKRDQLELIKNDPYKEAEALKLGSELTVLTAALEHVATSSDRLGEINNRLAKIEELKDKQRASNDKFLGGGLSGRINLIRNTALLGQFLSSDDKGKNQIISSGDNFNRMKEAVDYIKLTRSKEEGKKIEDKFLAESSRFSIEVAGLAEAMKEEGKLKEFEAEAKASQIKAANSLSELVKLTGENGFTKANTLLGQIHDTLLKMSAERFFKDDLKFEKPASPRLIDDKDIFFQGKKIQGRFQEQKIQQKANGGPIVGNGGSRTDSIPAMLSNGEFVVNAGATKRIGVKNLDFMNRSGKIPGFADGGEIDKKFYVTNTARDILNEIPSSNKAKRFLRSFDGGAGITSTDFVGEKLLNTAEGITGREMFTPDGKIFGGKKKTLFSDRNLWIDAPRFAINKMLKSLGLQDQGRSDLENQFEQMKRDYSYLQSDSDLSLQRQVDREDFRFARQDEKLEYDNLRQSQKEKQIAEILEKNKLASIPFVPEQLADNYERMKLLNRVHATYLQKQADAKKLKNKELDPDPLMTALTSHYMSDRERTKPFSYLEKIQAVERKKLEHLELENDIRAEDNEMAAYKLPTVSSKGQKLFDSIVQRMQDDFIVGKKNNPEKAKTFANLLKELEDVKNNKISITKISPYLQRLTNEEMAKTQPKEESIKEYAARLEKITGRPNDYSSSTGKEYKGVGSLENRSFSVKNQAIADKRKAESDARKKAFYEKYPQYKEAAEKREVYKNINFHRNVHAPGGALNTMASSGIVSGPGSAVSDSIPIMASAGEFIIKAARAKEIGYKNLEQMNSGVPRFANGGIVSKNINNTSAGRSGPNPIEIDMSKFITSLDTFKKEMTNIADRLDGLTITMEGKHEVNVVINGAEVLNELLNGPLSKLVSQEIQKAMKIIPLEQKQGN